MAARIFCKTGELRGQSFAIADEATVGSGHENTIVLAASTISREHARIFFDPERQHYVVEDLGSRNGTRLDGERVHAQERLDDLNVITFASTHDFIFQRLREDHPAAAREPAAPGSAEGPPRGRAERPARDPADGPRLDQGDSSPRYPTERPPRGPVEDSPRIVLEIELQNGVWTPFDLAQGANAVGRSRRCQITVDHGQLSRRHALLTVTGREVTVRDLQTTNYTYVNDERIATEVPVGAGTELRFGSVRARLRWE